MHSTYLNLRYFIHHIFVFIYICNCSMFSTVASIFFPSPPFPPFPAFESPFSLFASLSRKCKPCPSVPLSLEQTSFSSFLSFLLVFPFCSLLFFQYSSFASYLLCVSPPFTFTFTFTSYVVLPIHFKLSLPFHIPLKFSIRFGTWLFYFRYF